MDSRDWLTWSALDIGVELVLVSFGDVVTSAEDALRKDTTDNAEVVVELAATSASEHREIRSLLQVLSGDEDDENASERWRLAVLEAIHRSDLTDEQKVTQASLAYADFDYPEDMRDVSPYADSETSPLEALERVISELSNKLGVE